MKEIVLAIYDDEANNPNVMGQVQARAYVLDSLGQRIVSAANVVFKENHISSEVVQVEKVELRPDRNRPTCGKVVAICQFLSLQHRRLKKWEREEAYDLL